MRRTRREVLALTGAALASATAGCADGEADTDATQARLDAKNETIADLEADLDAKNETIAELEATVDDLTVEVRDYESEITALEADIDDKRAALASVEADLAAVESELDSALADRQALRDERDALESDLADLEALLDDAYPERTIPDAAIATATELALDLRESVVFVNSWGSTGTGFYIGGGEYLTADHVVAFLDNNWLQLFDGTETQFDIGRYDFDADALVATASQTPGTTAPLGSLSDVSEGDVCFTIANPFSVGTWVISIGRFRGEYEDDHGWVELFEMDAPARRRSSGAPVFSLDGEVVGLTVAEVSSHDGYEAPDDPFFHFGEYDPHTGFVSIDTVRDRVSV